MYEIVYRASQPYAAIPVATTMAELGETGPPLNDEVFGWLADHDIASVGPPFWKYDVIDMARTLELQVGVATSTPAHGDGRVVTGELPAGRYLQTVHHGHPDHLEQAVAALLSHAETEGLTFDVTDEPEGQRWAGRLEFYLTDPQEEPNLDEWDTVLAFKLAD